MAPVLPLDRLLDDASQFPPGNLPLEPAWEAHRRWRHSDRAPLVGRFLVPSARAGALTQLILRDGSEGIELGIVVGGDGFDGLGSLAAYTTSVELRGSVDDAARWCNQFPDATVFLEGVPPAAVSVLRERNGRVGAKLRCGGLKAAAFPSVETVAVFVESCVRLDVPFKATAGLHQPLRHWDPEIGVLHHGFLNIWAATALAARGTGGSDVREVLEIDHPDSWRKLALSRAEIDQARRWFTAFGTCSIDEPLDGLASIGLLDG
jgi:hypothetical protein